MRRIVAEIVYNFFAMPGPRQKRREHDRELAIAYLGVGSVDEVRLDRVIDEHIERVLAASDQNLSLTADLLGMHRRSLQRYVRRKQRTSRKRAGGKQRAGAKQRAGRKQRRGVKKRRARA